MSEPHGFLDYWPDDIKGLTVMDGEFVVTTADAADRPDDGPVVDLLQRVRRGLGMDIVFISQFTEGERVIRHVAAKDEASAQFHPGECDPLEETFCQQVVDGRQPQLAGRLRPGGTPPRADAHRRVGAYVTVPIAAPNGAVFGTLCCISETERPQLGERSELQAVKAVAELLSSALRRAA